MNAIIIIALLAIALIWGVWAAIGSAILAFIILVLINLG